MNTATGTDAVRQAFPITAGELAGEAARLFAAGYRLAAVAAHDDEHTLRVVYVFCAGPPDRRAELEVRLDPAHPVVPSLAGLSFPASRFEREFRDLFGITPQDHPFPRRLVLHQHWPEGWHPMRRQAGPPPPMQAGAGPFPFVRVEGPGVYEIPVGPVHAGLIEPGHFRFSVAGETILKMKARLWYLHRGVERLFEGQDTHAAVRLAECVSGDSAVAHNLAYSLRSRTPARSRSPSTRRGCARYCSNSSASTTTSPTSARCATTSASASPRHEHSPCARSCCASTPR